MPTNSHPIALVLANVSVIKEIALLWPGLAAGVINVTLLEATPREEKGGEIPVSFNTP